MSASVCLSYNQLWISEERRGVATVATVAAAAIVTETATANSWATMSEWRVQFSLYPSHPQPLLLPLLLSQAYVLSLSLSVRAKHNATRITCNDMVQDVHHVAWLWLFHSGKELRSERRDLKGKHLKAKQSRGRRASLCATLDDRRREQAVVEAEYRRGTITL